MSSENSEISDIAKFLIKNENVCLVIRGAWGVGKTCRWRKVEKEIEEKNKEKQVVYIDLFGKESYKQILEEIVLNINENCNERVKEFCDKAKSLFQSFKGVALGVMGVNAEINIDVSSIFSIFKKEDFENIIVCFDNIERKSDKLPLDEILGLVNLLKEDKSCNVVMIFDKDKLDKRESNNNEVSPKDWYETYKEKVIDYEIVIDNNDEIAQEIIEDNLRWDTKERKQEIVNLIFECFKEEFNNNLRLLMKFIRHIDYFNKHCFFECYEKDKYKEFLVVLGLYYGAMAVAIKQYYSLLVKDEKRLEFYCRYYKIFLNSLLELNNQDKKSLKSDFLNLLNNEIRLAKEQAKEALEKKRREFKFSNLEDDKYTQEIRKAFEAIERYILESQYAVKDYEDYIASIEEYNRLTGETIKPNKEVIDINEKHEKTLAEQNCKEHKNDFKPFIERKLYATEKIFSLQNISEYNKFSVDKIVQEFRTNKSFYDEFFRYFSKIESENDVNKYHLQNNLFQAYKTFINRKATKNKKQTIKETLEETRIGNILYKEYTENQNQDSPYKKFFEYFKKEYAPRNNMHPYTPNISILMYHLLQAYKEFCGKDENKEEKEKMEENLKKNPLTGIILKLINEEE